jgi:hypothetical protein
MPKFSRRWRVRRGRARRPGSLPALQAERYAVDLQ